jgi:hypothetical protein
VSQAEERLDRTALVGEASRAPGDHGGEAPWLNRLARDGGSVQPRRSPSDEPVACGEATTRAIEIAGWSLLPCTAKQHARRASEPSCQYPPTCRARESHAQPPNGVSAPEPVPAGSVLVQPRHVSATTNTGDCGVGRIAARVLWSAERIGPATHAAATRECHDQSADTCSDPRAPGVRNPGTMHDHRARMGSRWNQSHPTRSGGLTGAPQHRHE